MLSSDIRFIGDAVISLRLMPARSLGQPWNWVQRLRIGECRPPLPPLSVISPGEDDGSSPGVPKPPAVLLAAGRCVCLPPRLRSLDVVDDVPYEEKYAGNKRLRAGRIMGRQEQMTDMFSSIMVHIEESISTRRALADTEHIENYVTYKLCPGWWKRGPGSAFEGCW